MFIKLQGNSGSYLLRVDLIVSVEDSRDVNVDRDWVKSVIEYKEKDGGGVTQYYSRCTVDEIWKMLNELNAKQIKIV